MPPASLQVFQKAYLLSSLSKSSVEGDDLNFNSLRQSRIDLVGVSLSHHLYQIMPHFLSSTWRRLTSRRTAVGKVAQERPIPTESALGKDSGAPLDPIILSTSHLTSTLPAGSFTDSSMGNCTWHNLLSSPFTKSNTFTVGIGVCQPKTGNLALHRHEQAEFYYVLSGNSVIRIEGKDHVVTAGDVIFIPGNAEHSVFNYGSEEFRFLYCFGVGSFQEVVYRFTKVSGAISDTKVIHGELNQLRMLWTWVGFVILSEALSTLNLLGDWLPFVCVPFSAWAYCYRVVAIERCNSCVLINLRKQLENKWNFASNQRTIVSDADLRIEAWDIPDPHLPDRIDHDSRSRNDPLTNIEIDDIRAVNSMAHCNK